MSQIGIIPHAGEKYSGLCRKNVFKNMKKKANVMYIINDHHNIGKNYWYQINNNSNKLNEKWIETISGKEEHSYHWVIEEINSYFIGKVESFMLGQKWESKKIEILQILKNHINNGGVILVTIDLTHYGKEYNFINIPKPNSYNKFLFEEKLIESLLSSNIISVKEELQKKPNLTCSKLNCLLVTQLTKSLNFKGRVIEYYDSSSKSKLKYKKYLVGHNSNIWVSYVGIIYQKKINMKLNKFDTQLALAFIRSNIEYPNSNYKLPKWSIWYQKKNGVFIATDYQGKKTCCVGEYQTNGKSSADFINGLYPRCIVDGSRWDFNFTNKDINKFNFELEILQDNKKWKRTTPSNLKLTAQEPYGIYLTINEKSATYLPYVWLESIPEAKNVYQILDSLARKAGYLKNNIDWEIDTTSKIKLYTSKKYFSKDIYKTRKK